MTKTRTRIIPGKGVVTELVLDNSEQPTLQVEGNIDTVGGQVLENGQPIEGGGGGNVTNNITSAASNVFTWLFEEDSDGVVGGKIDFSTDDEGGYLINNFDRIRVGATDSEEGGFDTIFPLILKDFESGNGYRAKVFKTDEPENNCVYEIYRVNRNLPENYRGFHAYVGRTWGNDPSINRLIITRENGPLTILGSVDTDPDDFGVSEISSELIIATNVYTNLNDYQPVSKEQMQNYFNAIVDRVIYGNDPEASEAITDINTLKQNFDDNMEYFKTLLPELFPDFLFDISSSYIEDGGSDQYDTGNYINSSANQGIPYGGGEVQEGYFGAGSSHVVTYTNGLFAMIVTQNNSTLFQYGGGTGSDGSGYRDAYYTREPIGYTLRIRKLYDSGEFTTELENEDSVSVEFFGAGTADIRPNASYMYINKTEGFTTLTVDSSSQKVWLAFPQSNPSGNGSFAGALVQYHAWSYENNRSYSVTGQFCITGRDHGMPSENNHIESFAGSNTGNTTFWRPLEGEGVDYLKICLEDANYTNDEMSPYTVRIVYTATIFFDND